VLVADDRADVRISARFVLEDNHYQVTEAENPTMTKELIKLQRVDLVLLDMNYSRDTTSGEEGVMYLYVTDASGLPLVYLTRHGFVFMHTQHQMHMIARDCSLTHKHRYPCQILMITTIPYLLPRPVCARNSYLNIYQ
jgi:DNA-binding NtrC family response regulator